MEFRGPADRLHEIAAGLREHGRMDAEITASIGTAAIAMIQHRTTVLHLDVDGGQFVPYSTKPLYISGEYEGLARSAGGRTKYLSGERKEFRRIKGRSGVKTLQLRSVTRSGKRTEKKLKKIDSRGGRSIYKLKDVRTSVMKSVFFDNGWSQFKSGIGHEGVDLMVNGTMLGGMGNPNPFGVTSSTEKSVTIGFIDQTQLKKAEGNNKRREFWGVARFQNERERIARISGRALAQKIQRLIHGNGESPDEIMRTEMSTDGTEIK